MFTVSAWVRQGCPMSPVLFAGSLTRSLGIWSGWWGRTGRFWHMRKILLSVFETSGLSRMRLPGWQFPRTLAAFLVHSLIFIPFY